MLKPNKIDINIVGERYFIHKDGGVWDKKRQQYLKQCTVTGGYKRVVVRYKEGRKHILVHRLVALKYIKGETAKKHEVNHIDGNKENNNIGNLEWVTHRENQIHSRKVLGNKCTNPNPPIKKLRNKIINELYGKYTTTQLAEAFEITPTRVMQILKPSP